MYPPRYPPDEADDVKLIGGIASGVAGVGMFVVMGVAMGQVSSLQDDPGFAAYRSGLSPEESACVEADSGRSVSATGASTPEQVQNLCSEATTFTTLSYASIPIGAVLVGVGTYFIVTSDTVWPAFAGTHIRLTPSVGMDGASAIGSVDF
jgi:hypothetical protein